MPTRREFLRQAGSATVGAIILPFVHPEHSSVDKIVSAEDMEFLRGMARDTVKSATVVKTACSFPMVTPGGNYPAFWIRDFSMALGCGLIDDETVHNHLRLIAETQNGADERKLESGAIVPPFAIADHINFDGKPVFYPGTYSSGEDQGGEPNGILPPIDDHFEFVNIAHELWRTTKRVAFLREVVQGSSLLERLHKAVESPKTDPKSGLITTDKLRRAVGFGFCDSVYMTGDLCFASLVRFRALGQMAELAKAIGAADLATELAKSRKQISKSVESTFFKDGWLTASTGMSGEPDVWATLFALHLGVLGGKAEKLALRTILEAVRGGTITYQGAVRHVPTDHDFSSTTSWQQTAGVPLNRYQNGAYWHVPTGWLIEALAKTDRRLAKKVADEMIGHLRKEDFRQGGGAPWECFSPDGYRQNRVYMASVTLPLRILSGL